MEIKYGNLNVSEVRQMMELDFKNIMCGMNIFDYVELGGQLRSNATFIWGMSITPLNEAIEQMVINISKVIRDYLTYDPEFIPDPLEYYKWIVSKRDDIEDILKEEMSFSFGDEPFKFCILHHILHKFELIWNHLVGVGSVHKFDEEIVRQKLYGDQIRQDEED